MPAKKNSTIICSNKGGVGKTMVSLLLSLLYAKAQYPLTIIEIDNEKKLSSMLPNGTDVISIDATQNIEVIIEDRFASETHFNQVYNGWQNSDSLTDLGANMTTALFNWFSYCEIGEMAAEDNIEFRVVACASPDDQALKSAIDAIDTAHRALGNSAEYFVILNQTSDGAGFKPYDLNPSFLELKKREANGSIRLIEIPYCSSRLNEFGRAMKLNPIQIIERLDEVVERAGLDQVAARVHKKKLMTWLNNAAEALGPLQIVEERVQVAAAG